MSEAADHRHNLQDLALEHRLRKHVQTLHGGSVQPALGFQALREWHHRRHQKAGPGGISANRPAPGPTGAKHKGNRHG